MECEIEVLQQSVLCLLFCDRFYDFLNVKNCIIINMVFQKKSNYIEH